MHECNCEGHGKGYTEGKDQNPDLECQNIIDIFVINVACSIKYMY